MLKLALINPLNPKLPFGYIILRTTRTGSASAERVRQGDVGGVTRRMTYTWWLLGLDVKVPWLGPCGPILALAGWTGFENATLTL